MKKPLLLLALHLSAAPTLAGTYNTAAARGIVRTVQLAPTNECFARIETQDDLLWVALPDNGQCASLAIDACLEASGKVAEIIFPPEHVPDHVNLSAEKWEIVDASLCE